MANKRRDEKIERYFSRREREDDQLRRVYTQLTPGDGYGALGSKKAFILAAQRRFGSKLANRKRLDRIIGSVEAYNRHKFGKFKFPRLPIYANRVGEVSNFCSTNFS